ncbi:TetR/AcrR family transcriptional regulator [Furfurilactobacillus milii]|uniref:TetR family transcriptional regulator n=1 Tax=Furfurilactobacillus milii TaxID=2888272 RepID=A0A6N9I0S1_9LACO|nr:TetR/AcrR family transcriptional regulator [Furfurilactobacillus milii]MYV16026.1 TetR family transcriptional regulator [Furfurilactobacillus milii]
MTIKPESFRQEKTRQELINAMRTLLMHKPFEQISVNDICEQSHNHRSTFYRYYHDKYDLLQDEFRVVRETMDADNQIPSRQFVEQIVDFAQENQRVFRNLTTANSHENMYYVLTAATEQTLKEKLVEQKKTDDPLIQQVEDSPRPDLVISLIAGAIVNLMIRWVTTEQSTPKDEIVTFLTDGLNRICVVPET